MVKPDMASNKNTTSKKRSAVAIAAAAAMTGACLPVQAFADAPQAIEQEAVTEEIEATPLIDTDDKTVNDNDEEVLGALDEGENSDKNENENEDVLESDEGAEGISPFEKSIPDAENTFEEELQETGTAIVVGSDGSEASYDKLSEAVVNAPAGSTVKLTRDIDWSVDENGTDAYQTLDLNGITLDLNGHTFKTGYAPDKASALICFQGTNARVTNGHFISNGSYGVWIGDAGTTDGFMLDNVTINAGVNIFNAYNVTLDSVTADVNMDKNAYYAIWLDENAHVDVKSGNYSSNGPAVLGVSKNSSDLAVYDGTFTALKGSPLQRR